MKRDLWDVSVYDTLGHVPSSQLLHSVQNILFSEAWDVVQLQSLLYSTAGEESWHAVEFSHAQDPSSPDEACTWRVRADILNQAFAKPRLLGGWTIPHCVRLLEVILNSARTLSQHDASTSGGQQKLSATGSRTSIATFRCVPVAGVVRPRPACYSAACATARSHINALTHAHDKDLQRAADCLYMSATAAMHHHAYSNESMQRLKQEALADALVMQWLQQEGFMPEETLHIPSASVHMPGTPSHSESVPLEWTAHYRNCLRASTVHPVGDDEVVEPSPHLPELADVLLCRWVAQNQTIAASVHKGHGTAVIDATGYSSWCTMPLTTRLDVQPFCMHPLLVAAADVTVERAPKGLAVQLQFDDVLRVRISMGLAKSFACLCCAVTESLLRHRMRAKPVSRPP